MPEDQIIYARDLINQAYSEYLDLCAAINSIIATVVAADDDDEVDAIAYQRFRQETHLCDN